MLRIKYCIVSFNEWLDGDVESVFMMVREKKYYAEAEEKFTYVKQMASIKIGWSTNK